MKITTEILSNNSPKWRSEQLADTLLRPVQYLWNGRKIAVFQTPKNKIFAFQVADIYNPKQRSFLKTALMIALFIPSLIIGGALKLCVNKLKYSEQLDNELQKREGKKAIYIINMPAAVKGTPDERYFSNLKPFIEALKTLDQFKGKMPFLYDIKTLFLCHWMSSDEKAKNAQRLIEEHTEEHTYFLPNLKEIHIKARGEKSQHD